MIVFDDADIEAVVEGMYFGHYNAGYITAACRFHAQKRYLMIRCGKLGAAVATLGKPALMTSLRSWTLKLAGVSGTRQQGGRRGGATGHYQSDHW